MFLMQVEAKLISIKEKLLYLLHSVGPKVREGIAYLKPETVGYRTHLFAQKLGDKQKPYCPLYQTHDHLSVNCTIVTALVDSKNSYGHNFISPETVELLKLKQIGDEMRKIFTVNGTKVRSIPIFDSHIRSLDGRSSEQI
ncbi:unnamed protein product [Pocillopora meandrina]|uniref:Uncharacterized protein n=1 Tax=Pocillopora meandrina TaxID=46732 RepID=A0AAU9XQ08_9CNID|nr:unnamed protein product [Pocillopora meandrina]